MSEIVILAVCFQLKQLKKQPKKNSGLNGTRTHDLAIPIPIPIPIPWSWVRVPFKPEFFSGCFFNCLS